MKKENKALEILSKVAALLQQHQREDKKILAGYTLAANLGEDATEITNEIARFFSSISKDPAPTPSPLPETGVKPDSYGFYLFADKKPAHNQEIIYWFGGEKKGVFDGKNNVIAGIGRPPKYWKPLPETETGADNWEAFEKEIDELENALWDEPTGAPPTPGNEQRSQIWPEKITAAEVEAGVKWSFAVCFEIARRYNEYKEATETEVTRLKDLLNSLQGMQPWITDRELQEKFTSVMNQINQ